jgi:hypothetical protein
MNFTDSATISGKWHFRSIGSPTNIGPQTGDGNLVGGVENGRVWIELNPQFKDNNLQLTGTLQGGRYSGQWMQCKKKSPGLVVLAILETSFGKPVL